MIIGLSIALLIVAAALAVLRLFQGPTIADRIVALDVILVTLMAVIAVRAADQGTTLPLSILVAIAVVAFTATVALTRYIERSGRA